MRASKLSILVLALALGLPALAQQPQFVFLNLGDSIGEGVQSGDASIQTQTHSYPYVLAYILQIPFELPLIQSNPLGFVSGVDGRTRINPTVVSPNLAVSGADVGDLLRLQADGIVDQEVDLVLAPNTGSQIEIAEQLTAYLTLCWIGNNDVLQAVTSFDQLDASQITPTASFQADFEEIASRLLATGRAVVFANIPDVDKIGFLVDGQDLIRFTGSDWGLPAGHKTSVVEMLLLRAGFDDGTNLQNPGFVLTPAEQTTIQQRIDTFNQIIAATAASHGMPVVDINGLFDDAVANPPVHAGVALSPRFQGGLFSLDGVHPSNIGHALIANAFVDTMNSFFGFTIPPLSPAILDQVALADPFVDKDSDGVVPGRPFASLLESLAFLAGFSGDSNDASAAASVAVNPTAMLDEAVRSNDRARRNGRVSGTSRRPTTKRAQKEAVTEALRRAFGLSNRRGRP